MGRLGTAASRPANLTNDSPMDDEAIVATVKKTNRVLIVHEDVPLPYSPPLEDYVLPQTSDIGVALRRLAAY
jgi:pyruvate/2-oxoglutarate/acetoin dehydrogenase E1 component